MSLHIVKKSINYDELVEMAKATFGDFIKAVVDIEQGIVVVGGELHSDGEALLLENGSKQENLWGINIYTSKSENERVEFNSMINIRPSQKNNSRGIEDPEIRAKIQAVVKKLVVG